MALVSFADNTSCLCVIKYEDLKFVSIRVIGFAEVKICDKNITYTKSCSFKEVNSKL